MSGQDSFSSHDFLDEQKPVIFLIYQVGSGLCDELSIPSEHGWIYRFAHYPMPLHLVVGSFPDC